MFGLKTDYRDLVFAIIDLLINKKKARVILIPHVFGPPEHLESDSTVSEEIYGQLKDEYKGRLFLARGTYDQSEIKYIIGLTDFFIGSRMHSCIAALSQSVPAVAVAYSKKFQGVMDSIELPNIVADPRCMDKFEILDLIDDAFENRAVTREHLDSILPKVRERVLGVFSDIEEQTHNLGHRASTKKTLPHNDLAARKVRP
jgi:polysaccharide pyruvyl transferase WcaK-like protein